MLLHELSAKHNLPLVHTITVLNIVAMFGPISRKDVLLRLLAEDAKLEPVFAPGLEHCMALLASPNRPGVQPFITTLDNIAHWTTGRSNGRPDFSIPDFSKDIDGAIREMLWYGSTAGSRTAVTIN